MSHPILRSEVLQTIPPKKVTRALIETLKECKECSVSGVKLNGACQVCRLKNTAKQRYAASNIPIAYWNLEMTRDFTGDSILLDKYNEITSDLSKAYDEGICLCFAGGHGTGKTTLCTNILKRASEKDYSCLYVTLTDIVELATSNQTPDKSIARKELLTVDFLVIDEFDPRHMGGTQAASDLYGRTLENIFRTRSQNSLPIFMCTNSSNVIDSFDGAIQQSIGSLMSFVEMVPVVGADFRKLKR